MPEPPYGIIANQLKQGNVIPFLGAGASLSGRPVDGKWDGTTAPFLPSAKELANRLAEDCSLPSNDPYDCDDLAKVSSYYAEVSADRAALRSALHQTLDRDYHIGAIHRFLADIDVPLLIVTTNYDDLIERAFRAKGKPYHLVRIPPTRKNLRRRCCGGNLVPANPKRIHPNRSHSRSQTRRSSTRCTARWIGKRPSGIRTSSRKKITWTFSRG